VAGAILPGINHNSPPKLHVISRKQF